MENELKDIKNESICIKSDLLKRRRRRSKEGKNSVKNDLEYWRSKLCYSMQQQLLSFDVLVSMMTPKGSPISINIF